jgi:hypothetical protein
MDTEAQQEIESLHSWKQLEMLKEWEYLIECPNKEGRWLLAAKKVAVYTKEYPK